MEKYIEIEEFIKEVQSFIRRLNYNSTSQVQILNSYKLELESKKYDYEIVNNLELKSKRYLDNLFSYINKLYSDIYDLYEYITENNVDMIEQTLKEFLY